MSLLRSLFWAGVFMLVLALAPDFGLLGPAADNGRQKAGLEDLFYVISATVSDLGGICGRRPEVCEKVDRIGEQFRNRAVRITGAAHEWLTDSERNRVVPVQAGTRPVSAPEPPPGRAAGVSYRLAKTPAKQGE